MNDRQSADEIETAASHWVWRLDREGAEAHLAAELEEWLAGDTRRRGALLRAQAAWAMLDKARVAAAPAKRPARKTNKKQVAAVAAGLAAAAAMVLALTYGSGLHHYSTAVGEIRQVRLDDGSTAAINTLSSLAVSMSDRERVVELRKGEAWFRVARDAARPFVVEAGRVRVRALGTAFSVRRHEKGADVLVTEGAVETWADGAEGHIVRVTAGGKAYVADNAAISEQGAASAQIERSLAWRTGQIDLAGEPLAEAVAEFNRYNARKIAVTDPELARQRLYGVFRTDDPEGFAYAVRRSLGARVTADAAQIRLDRGAP